MDVSTSITNEVVPTVIGNARRPFEKQLAIHLILASILLLFPPCYSLRHHLETCLEYNTTLNWDRTHALTAVDIFDGRF